ncbi:hypothetical protein H311_02320, partial [Anncaliia algerae PRA109]
MGILNGKLSGKGFFAFIRLVFLTRRSANNSDNLPYQENQSSSLHSCNDLILKSLLNSQDDEYACFKQNYMNVRKEHLNFCVDYENSKSTEETFCVYNEEDENKRLLFFDYIRKNFDPGIFQVINKACMTKYKCFPKSRSIEEIFYDNRNGIYIFYDNLNFNFMDVKEFSHL